MSLRAALVTATLPLLLLAACGEETGDGDSDAANASGSASDSGSPSGQESADDNPPPDAPDCTTVWKDDAKLPTSYIGCYEGEEFVAPTQRMCGFGKPIVTYGDTFYAVPGSPIQETSGGLDQDKKYARDLAACVA